MTFKEYDTVQLRQPLPSGAIDVGTPGAIVMVHAGGEAYEVEFVDPAGVTIAILTVNKEYLEPDQRSRP